MGREELCVEAMGDEGGEGGVGGLGEVEWEVVRVREGGAEAGEGDSGGMGGPWGV